MPQSVDIVLAKSANPIRSGDFVLNTQRGGYANAPLATGGYVALTPTITDIQAKYINRWTTKDA